MLALTQSTSTFPSVSIRSHAGGLPVEVSLIAQIGIGAGDALIADAMARQRGHAAFVDALDEPSARLGGVDMAQGDATSLYSFSVGAGGHPFHRHAGHRVFTAVSGSAGTQLRFSTASAAQIEADSEAFVTALQHVNIPPDSIFVVRFGGETWHQFVPLRRSEHPALFALSCHTNELGGGLPDDVRALVAANEADIPKLTEVLPEALVARLRGLDPLLVPTVALSLNEAPASMLARACAIARGTLGSIRAAWSRLRRPRGFMADNGGGRLVVELPGAPADSLLKEQLADGRVHEDSFRLRLAAGEIAATHDVQTVLAAVLTGFLQNRPLGVARLMAFRNVLVKPFGLRTSPLGCPVSSLLATGEGPRFLDRFPILSMRDEPYRGRVQVILGADDKHLRFRSCVTVERFDDGRVDVQLGTRVQTTNAFGHLYMVLIDRTHRGYVSPVMLRLAVDHAVRALRLPPVHLALPTTSRA
ncbi:MAG: DUF2867 domain-containing protein [Arenimonas sp.]